MENILKNLISKDLSINSISKITGKSYSTIRYWLKKYNLYTNFKSFKEIGKKEVGEYKYCPICKKNCKIIDFYIRSDSKGTTTYCKKCSNKKTVIRLKNIRKINRINNPQTSEEVGKKISDGLKLFYKNNPDNHPWKNSNKLKSVPCENFKNVLNQMNIKYIEEFTISNDRFFSVDVAIPQYKIVIEINGNQHYNKDGSLKEYYQLRHDFIENLGYKVYEFHYSLFFNNEKMINLINSVLENKKLFDFDYDKYLFDKLNRIKIKKERKYKLCECGDKINMRSITCNSCASLKKRKVERPLKSILTEDVKFFGYTETGKKYGVSRTTIKKWLN
jgi:very-short-patch-repair endonuclease